MTTQISQEMFNLQLISRSNLNNKEDQHNGTSKVHPIDKCGSSAKTLKNIEQNNSFRQIIDRIVKNKKFDKFILQLIILYTLIVFLNVALVDFESDQAVKDVSRIILYIELSILLIFQLEIMMRVVQKTFKKYFRNNLIIADALIIVISIVLVVIDIEGGLGSFEQISKIFKNFSSLQKGFPIVKFQFTEMSKFKKIYSKFDIQTPSTKVQRILQELAAEVDSKELELDIKWICALIQSNKLSDNLNALSDKGQDWSKLVGGEDQQEKQVNSSNAGQTKRKDEKQIMINQAKNEINIPVSAQNYFLKVDEIDFNCQLSELPCQNQILGYFLVYMFEREGFFGSLNISAQSLLKFGNKIQSMYFDNSYHNKFHALDVAQTITFFLYSCDVISACDLSDMDIAAMLISGIVHDVEHPGLTNIYLINSKNNLAIRYNDQSVLENHHVATTFQVIFDSPEFNIFQQFTYENLNKIRKSMLSMVLGTDMSHHFAKLGSLKAKLAAEDYDLKNKDKQFFMDVCVHAADISNPLKPFQIYEQWAYKVLDEFWAQGDIERKQNLPISYLCDRYTTNTAKSQIGFINIIVEPTFEILKSYFPLLEQYCDNFKLNKAKWEEKIAHYDAKLETLNNNKQFEDEEIQE